jgi:hypothetical protein
LLFLSIGISPQDWLCHRIRASPAIEHAGDAFLLRYDEFEPKIRPERPAVPANDRIRQAPLDHDGLYAWRSALDAPRVVTSYDPTGGVLAHGIPKKVERK